MSGRSTCLPAMGQAWRRPSATASSPSASCVANRWGRSPSSPATPEPPSDRRFGVVLDGALDALRFLDTAQAGDEVQGHVDAGRHAGRGDHLAVVDEPVVGPDLDVPTLADGGQLVE